MVFTDHLSAHSGLAKHSSVEHLGFDIDMDSKKIVALGQAPKRLLQTSSRRVPPCHDSSASGAPAPRKGGVGGLAPDLRNPAPTSESTAHRINEKRPAPICVGLDTHDNQHVGLARAPERSSTSRRVRPGPSFRQATRPPYWSPHYASTAGCRGLALCSTYAAILRFNWPPARAWRKAAESINPFCWVGSRLAHS